MWKALQSKDVRVRILLGVFVTLIGLGMLVYLIPGQGSSATARTDVLAEVGGQEITQAEVRRQLQQIGARGSIPRALEGLYAKQILNQLVFQQMLEVEAKRLGIRVTNQERRDRIRELLPTAFSGDSFVGLDRYSADVQLRFQMGVSEFEELVRQSLLEEKFRRLVTDGIGVMPEEVEQEFRRRNEKITVEYVVIKPEDLESKVPVTDSDLTAYFEKNRSRYVIPERRVVRYALLDANQLRQRVSVSDEDLRAYYNQHIDQYRLQNRVHVSHILFKTIGKTDAEVEETRKKAEEALAQARHKANFAELAKQYSEDNTKDKGGDLGWIVQGQTVAEFEKAAFSLAPGAVSDLVKTQYGFHILKVLEHENARTQSLEEVRASILTAVAGEKAQLELNRQAEALAAAVRRSNQQPIDQVAQQAALVVRESRPIAATESLPELGSSEDLRDAIFRSRPGELNAPIRTDRGFVLFTVKQVQPGHPGTLDEVREKVSADLRRDQAVEIAKIRAAELAKRTPSGEDFRAAAKAMGFEAKTSDPVARTGSIPGIGSARQLAAAFGAPVGQTAAPVSLGSGWVVYRVAEREEYKPEELDKQRKEIEQQVLHSKRQAAYEAFRNALEERLRKEGKVKMMTENIKRLGGSGASL